MSENNDEKVIEDIDDGGMVFEACLPPESVLARMREQSTWRLLLLSVITIGIYQAHYMKRQALKINALTFPEARISIGFANTLIVLSYLSAAMLVPYVMAEDDSPVNAVLDCLDTIILCMFLFLSFAMRDHLHFLLASQFRSVRWFGALWTFLFGVLYINFRINKLEELARSSYS